MINRRLTTTLARPLAPFAALALLGVCAVHLLDGPHSVQDQAYLGVLELLLAVACVPLAVLLLIEPIRATWDVALALNLLALLVFVTSRTVGLPGSTGDIGNWSPLLGVLNMVAEGSVIGIAALALATTPRADRHPLTRNSA
jgi:hypothetical protein